RRRHTSSKRDWSSDVCSSDLHREPPLNRRSSKPTVRLLVSPRGRATPVSRASRSGPTLPPPHEQELHARELRPAQSADPRIPSRSEPLPRRRAVLLGDLALRV